MRPWEPALAGTWHFLELDSRLLRGNPLGDPHVRPLPVYTPPGYEADGAARYPSIYVLQGYTGRVDAWWNRSAWRVSLPEAVDSLFAGGAPPCIVVLVDAWTALGGSQFVDSPAVGAYHSYLCDEIVPFVDSRFRTLAAAAHRGLMGKSSGGYGAMVTPMLRPDLFGGLATHAGDALFEHSLQQLFPLVARALQRDHNGSWDAFLADFRSRPAFTRKSDHDLLITYAMAACYSAEPDGSVLFPFDLVTGQLVPEIWMRWLHWDPVRMVARHGEAVRGLRAIWIDAGLHDEWFADLGAEAFRRALAEAGVDDVHFELFDAGHGAIEYRYPMSLAYLADRLIP